MALSYGFALRDTDNSADFSEAMRAVFGDGITLEGGCFALSINGFTATVSSGYALAMGRWLQNDEPLALPIMPPNNNGDRYDAIAVRVDYEERKATLEVLIGVDPTDIKAGADMIVMHLIRVKRGATSLTPNDVTDLRESDMCGSVVPLSAITEKVLYIYNFLTSGIDASVARIVELSNQVAAKADAAIVELDAAIQKAGGDVAIGELMTSRHPPSETGWIVCGGGDVPEEYPALSALLGGVLPNIPGERYKTYIFGGAPVEV